MPRVRKRPRTARYNQGKNRAKVKRKLIRRKEKKAAEEWGTFVTKRGVKKISWD